MWLLDQNLTATSQFIFMILLCVLIFMLYHGSMNYQIEKQYRTLSIRLNRELEKAQTTAIAIVKDNSSNVHNRGLSSRSSKSGTLKNNGIKASQRHSKNKAQKRELDEFITAYALTEKEADILKEIVQLKSIRAMALDLDITERTVKYRISRIFEKTGTKNQRELISIISE